VVIRFFYSFVREMINLNHIQRKILATLVGFILSSLWLAELDIDPWRMYERETDQIREYIVIPKSDMTKLERKGEAPWLGK
jgi:hypothetical protein